MTEIIFQMAMSMAVTVFRAVIKNPASVAKEGAVIAEVALLSTQADQQVNNNVWSLAPKV